MLVICAHVLHITRNQHCSALLDGTGSSGEGIPAWLHFHLNNSQGLPAHLTQQAALCLPVMAQGHLLPCAIQCPPQIIGPTAGAQAGAFLLTEAVAHLHTGSRRGEGCREVADRAEKQIIGLDMSYLGLPVTSKA